MGKAARRAEPPFLLLSVKELLAGALPAVCATERGARRTGKAIASRIGLPVAAAIAVAVIVIVAIIEGTERRGRDRACRCDGTADYGTRRADRPHRPGILIPGHDSVCVAKPFATIGRAALHVALAFGVGHLFVLRTCGHGALGHRGPGQRGGEDRGGTEDRKTQSRHGTLPFW